MTSSKWLVHVIPLLVWTGLILVWHPGLDWFSLCHPVFDVWSQLVWFMSFSVWHNWFGLCHSTVDVYFELVWLTVSALNWFGSQHLLWTGLVHSIWFQLVWFTASCLDRFGSQHPVSTDFVHSVWSRLVWFGFNFLALIGLGQKHTEC